MTRRLFLCPSGREVYPDAAQQYREAQVGALGKEAIRKGWLLLLMPNWREVYPDRVQHQFLVTTANCNDEHQSLSRWGYQPIRSLRSEIRGRQTEDGGQWREKAEGKSIEIDLTIS